MVDQEARREYAELVRQFTSGRMTADEYDRRCFAIRVNKKDSAIHEIGDRLSFVYEDARPDRLTKEWRLDAAARRQVAQAVLFLQSGEEYQWREELWDGSVFLITAFLTFLLHVLFMDTATWVKIGFTVVLWTTWFMFERARLKRRRPTGDEQAWPFRFLADLDEAKRHPRLLNGGRYKAGH